MLTPQSFVTFGLFILCLVVQNVCICSEDLTGEEILQKSKAAMRQPYSFKRHTKNGIMTEYVKWLSETARARLIDEKFGDNMPEDQSPYPPLRLIKIMYGYEGWYELFPDEMIAIEITYQARELKKSIEEGFARRAENNADLTITRVDSVTAAEYEGHPCFEVKTTGIKNGVPVNTESRMIDKETFLLRFYEITRNSTGKTSGFVHSDISPEPELTDDFFRLPNGFEVKTVENRHDYDDLHKAITEKRFEGWRQRINRENQTFTEGILARAKENTAGVHKETKMAQSKREQEIKELQAKFEEEKKQREAERAAPTPAVFTTGRIVALIVCNTITLVFLIYLFFLHFRKKG